MPELFDRHLAMLALVLLAVLSAAVVWSVRSRSPRLRTLVILGASCLLAATLWSLWLGGFFVAVWVVAVLALRARHAGHARLAAGGFALFVFITVPVALAALRSLAAWHGGPWDFARACRNVAPPFAPAQLAEAGYQTDARLPGGNLRAMHVLLGAEGIDFVELDGAGLYHKVFRVGAEDARCARLIDTAGRILRSDKQQPAWVVTYAGEGPCTVRESRSHPVSRYRLTYTAKRGAIFGVERIEETLTDRVTEKTVGSAVYYRHREDWCPHNPYKNANLFERGLRTQSQANALL